MLKSIQIKIVLAFAIVGIIVITTFGLVSIYNLQELQNLALSTAKNIRNKWEYWKSDISN